MENINICWFPKYLYDITIEFVTNISYSKSHNYHLLLVVIDFLTQTSYDVFGYKAFIIS